MLVDNVTVAVNRLATGLLVPAQDTPPPPGQLPEWGNAAPAGLAIVLLLLLATVFLIRNMSKRITRLPESFDGSAEATPGPAAEDARRDRP
ncbi:hypothetical protein [Pseudonocardia spirodelae]|uniref:Uncharacterized protein n=1 Tax=Pseudonocardia spirodelae TaxID=3133431 RepID=A0ABU8T904_9PSEU